MPRSDGPPPWGGHWGAAGVVALRGQRGRQHVCLVEKRGGSLGFPTGGAESGDVDPWHTAMREWLGETELPIEPLGSKLGPESAIVDMCHCHYFVVKWVMVGLVRTKEQRKKSLFGNTPKRKNTLTHSLHTLTHFGSTPRDFRRTAIYSQLFYFPRFFVWYSLVFYSPRPSPPPPRRSFLDERFEPSR